MICPVCDQDIHGSCLCGFCTKCLRAYGHDQCIRMARENKEAKEQEKKDKEMQEAGKHGE